MKKKKKKGIKTLLLVFKKKGQLLLYSNSFEISSCGITWQRFVKKSITAAVWREGKKGQLTRPDCNSSASSHNAHLTTAQPCKLLNNKSQSRTVLGGQNAFDCKADRGLWIIHISSKDKTSKEEMRRILPNRFSCTEIYLLITDTYLGIQPVKVMPELRRRRQLQPRF